MGKRIAFRTAAISLTDSNHSKADSKKGIAQRWEAAGAGAVNRGFVRFGFVYLSSGRTHTHKHSCSLVSCDPLIRARFGPTVGHINLQLQQQADASNLAM